VEKAKEETDRITNTYSLIGKKARVDDLREI
jgi:hypothetical protein